MLIFFVCQMVLDESEGILGSLEAFGPSLQDILAVCDIGTLEQNLLQIRTSVSHMKRSVLEPLSRLQHAAEVSTRVTGYTLMKT